MGTFIEHGNLKPHMQSITTTTTTIKNTHNKEMNHQSNKITKTHLCIFFVDYCSQLMIFGIIQKISINTQNGNIKKSS
jgi:hypothetical protein